LSGCDIPASRAAHAGGQPDFQIDPEPATGLLNTFLRSIGLGSWRSNGVTPAWQCFRYRRGYLESRGYLMVILIAGIQAIPTEYSRQRQSMEQAVGQFSVTSRCRC